MATRKITPQYGGIYKTPAGTTTASRGAGGGAPGANAQAPNPFSGQDNTAVDMASLGGLIGLMMANGATDTTKPTSGAWLDNPTAGNKNDWTSNLPIYNNATGQMNQNPLQQKPQVDDWAMTMPVYVGKGNGHDFY